MIRQKWRPSQNRVSRYDLRRSIDAYSTEPFADVLAFLLRCRPNEAELTEFANKSPDKWAAAIKIFASLSGYSEKIEHAHIHSGSVALMGDAEILQKLSELRGQMVSLAPTEYREMVSVLEGQVKEDQKQKEAVQNLDSPLVDANQQCDEREEGAFAPPPL